MEEISQTFKELKTLEQKLTLIRTIPLFIPPYFFSSPFFS